MGIFDAFRKDEVLGTRVLVCCCDPALEALAREDARIWKNHYPASDFVVAPEIHAVIDALDNKYDVVHLLCKADCNGALAGSSLQGTDLIDKCCASEVKLLWIASDNDPQSYINGFRAGGKRINLVMTVQRNGEQFASFLNRLLSRLSAGETMPVAWNALCPQIPGLNHPDVPSCIFFAGRGKVRLR